METISDTLNAKLCSKMRHRVIRIVFTTLLSVFFYSQIVGNHSVQIKAHYFLDEADSCLPQNSLPLFWYSMKCPSLQFQELLIINKWNSKSFKTKPNIYVSLKCRVQFFNTPKGSHSILYLYSRAVSLSKGVLFSKVIFTISTSPCSSTRVTEILFGRAPLSWKTLGGMAQAPERNVGLFVQHLLSNRYSIFLLTLQVSSVIYNSKYHPSYQ